MFFSPHHFYYLNIMKILWGNTVYKQLNFIIEISLKNTNLQIWLDRFNSPISHTSIDQTGIIYVFCYTIVQYYFKFL